MKKTLSLITLGLSLAAGVHAQQHRPALLKLNPEQARQWKLISSMIRHDAPAAKPTAIRQRVIAQVFNGADGGDSLRYSYTGTKGSRYNYNRLFEPGYSYEFYPDLAPAFESIDLQPSTDVLAGRIDYYFEGAADGQQFAYYNTSGKLDSAVNSDTKINIKYNSAGLPLEFSRLTTGSGGDIRKITYSGSQVATDSSFSDDGSGTLSFNYRYVYHYNTGGKLDTLWQESDVNSGSRYVFQYDAQGRLRKSEMAEISGGAPAVVVSTDSIGYTSGVDYMTYYLQSFSSDGETQTFALQQYPGAEEGPDSMAVSFLFAGNWLEVGKAYFTYNDEGNPELLSVESPDGNSELAFYYESYDDGTTSVADLPTLKDLQVYPNPFTSQVTLHYSGKQSRRVQLLLSDLSGRTVMTAAIQLQAGANRIDVPAVPAGAYLLHVRDSDGKSYSQKLLKR